MSMDHLRSLVEVARRGTITNAARALGLTQPALSRRIQLLEDEFGAPLLARSAVAAGVAAIFAEAHDDPDNAPSDGPVMLPLDWVGPMLDKLKAIDAIAKA